MIGICIIARLGSTRLSRKHLIKAQEQTFLEWLVARFSVAFASEIADRELRIFITTSHKEENRDFFPLFAGTATSVFQGSDENIPARLLECAQQQKLDHVIAIDGDDILCSTMAARSVIDALKTGSDIAQTKGLPLGMNVMGFRTSFLADSVQNSSDDIVETGWGRIFDPEKIQTINLAAPAGTDKIRMTLDYEQDAVFFAKVIEGLQDRITSISDDALIKHILDNQLYAINESLSAEYWSNFSNKKEAETK